MNMKKICGIYQFVNLVNDKIYIGGSVHIIHRQRGHLAALRHNRHGNTHLQRAWNKYGEDKFMFSVLEECNPENLREREQYWMDNKCVTDREKGYNIRPDAENRFFSEETRQKISKAKKGCKRTIEERERISETSKERWKDPEFRKHQSITSKIMNSTPERKLAFKQRMQELFDDPERRQKWLDKRKVTMSTPEYRQNMSIANTGKKRSEETKRKISEARKAFEARKKEKQFR